MKHNLSTTRNNLFIFISALLIVVNSDSSGLDLSNVMESSSFMTNESEFEADLVKLLSKIHEKKLQKQKKEQNNKDLINVKVRNFYDLQAYISKIKKLKDSILAEKENDNKILLTLSEKLDKQIKYHNDNLMQLKEKYDKIIEKSNNINKELNDRRSESISAKSNYESLTSEYDHFSEKFLENVKKDLKKFSNENPDKGYNFNINKINEKISSLNKDLNSRNLILQKNLKQKENSQKNEIQTKIIKKVANESKLDKKLFSIIYSNLENNIKEIKSGYLNSTISITSMKKVVKDTENLNKLEIEKSQQDEVYRELSKRMKKMLSQLESVQFEIKDSMKKKNQLKEKLNTKEIESNLKIDNLKNDITTIRKEIKLIEDKMLVNVKNHKTFLLQNELRLKNLILILNNLLKKIKLKKSLNSNYQGENLLNKILFDKNILDVDSAVDDNIIDEINNSILSI